MGDLEVKEEGTRGEQGFLEFEPLSVRERNPIPMVGAPTVGADRVAKVPRDMEQYLKKRYGPNIDIAVLSRFGNEDLSGYSYEVRYGGEHVAEIEARRGRIDILPPDYEGVLRKPFEKISYSNLFLTRDSRLEVLERTLWHVKEEPRAVELRKQQLARSSI